MAAPAVTLLDGGFATELERRGADPSDDLWSARLLADDPDEIVATHLAFFRVGAQVATTASYQASFEGFARHGLSAAHAERLMRSSVELARVAASLAEAEDGVRRVVAASTAPTRRPVRGPDPVRWSTRRSRRSGWRRVRCTSEVVAVSGRPTSRGWPLPSPDRLLLR